MENNKNSDNNTQSKENLTLNQTLGEINNEDFAYLMESVQKIGSFLECRKEYELPEYREALQGWSNLNALLNSEAKDRIQQ